jgi:hypothetical protein
MLSSHLLLDHSSALLLSGFPAKILFAFFINSCYSSPERRASTKQCQRTVFWASAVTSFHVLPAFPASSTTILFQVILGLPLLHCPWGFQFRAWFSMAVGPFRRVCPVHVRFLHLICCSKGVSWARLQSSTFDIVFGQKILKIFLRHLFMKVCKSSKILFVDFQVSHAKRRTDLTLLLKIFSFDSS